MGSRGPDNELPATEPARTDRPRQERRGAQARSGMYLREQALLGLQRAAGNAATTALLARGRSGQTASGVQGRAPRLDAVRAPKPPSAEPAHGAVPRIDSGGGPAVSGPPRRPAPTQPMAAPPAAASQPAGDQHQAEPSATAMPGTAHAGGEPVAVVRGEGPTAQEGARQLVAATAELEAALEEQTPASAGTPETAAGAVIVEAVAAAGRAGRADVAAGARAALADLQAGDAQLATLLSMDGGPAVAGVTTADRQAASAITASVGETTAQIAGEGRDHEARIGAWSAEAVPAAGRVVAEHADKAEAAGEEQARQAGAAAREAEQREAATVHTAAARAEPGTGAGGSGAGAQAGQVVDRRRSAGTATVRQVRGAAPDAGQGVRARTAEAAAALRGGGSKVAAAMAGKARSLTSALTRTATSAGSAVRQVAARTTRQATEGGAAARGRIAAAARTTTAALRTRADEVRGAGAAAAAGLVAGMAGAVRRVLGASVREEQAAAERFGRLRAAPAAAARIAGALGGQVARGHAGVATDLQRGGKEASAHLREAGSALTGELGAAGAEAQAAVADGAAQSAARVRGLAGPSRQAFGTVVAKATATGDEAVARTGRQLADVVNKADAGLGQVTSDVRAGLAEHEAQVSERAQTVVTQTANNSATVRRRVDGNPSGGLSLQRNVPQPPVGGWVGQQMSDLKDMVSDPGFWMGAGVTVGLLFALPLLLPALPALAVAGIALVVGGIVGGIVSALWGGGDILKGALIGGLIGLGFFLGGLLLEGAGLAGLALLGGVMLLGALIGIAVNLATGQRWDKGLLANLALAGLLHKFSKWVQNRRAGGPDQPGPSGQPKPDEPAAKPDEPAAKPDEPGAKQEEPAKEQQEQQERQEQNKVPPVLSALKQAVVGRAEVLADQIHRLRQRLGNTSRPTSTLAPELERDALAARDLIQKADNATTDAELNQIDRQLEALKKQNYNREVGVLRAEAADWVEAAERRVAALRERIPPKDRPRPPDPTKPEANRPDPVALRKGVADAETTVRDLRRSYQKASSQNALETLKNDAGKLLVTLKDLEVANEGFLLPPTLESAGIRPAAAEAIRLVDLKERDPLSDLHRSAADDRHFRPARREAQGEIVSSKDPSKSVGGKPYSHVNDIQNAHRAVSKAREAIIKELEQQPRDLTPYGRSKLQEQANKASRMIAEVDQFLDEIGWPANRPFQWVNERGRWVPAADVKAMRDMASGKLNDVAKQLQADTTTDTIREIRITNPTLATTLETRRAALQADVAKEQAGVNAVQTEQQATTFQQAVEKLQRLWKELGEDIHLSRVPK
jgi:hypothetical protein